MALHTPGSQTFGSRTHHPSATRAAGAARASTDFDILDNTRQIKQNLGTDEDWAGKVAMVKWRRLVFTALDVADELREAVLHCWQQARPVVYGRDIPSYYAEVICRQLDQIAASLKA